MTIRFHPEAERELDAAIRYYQDATPEVAEHFQHCLADGLEQIVQWPNAWQLVEMEARRYRVRHFPYGIVYKTYGDRTIIYAIMHLSRHPGYWAGRLT